MAGGSRSRRVETAWPNFTKIGPSSSSARRRRAPRLTVRRRSNHTSGERKNRKRSGRYRCVARTYSSRRCRSSTRWISSSRTSTRGFTAPRSASRCAAAGREQVQSRLQSIDTLAYRVHAAQELLALVARNQVAAFVAEVLGEIPQSGVRGARAEGGTEPCKPRELMGRYVPDQERQLLLGVRPQELRELTETLCDIAVAADVDVAALHDGLRRVTREREQAQEATRQRGIGGRIIARHRECLAGRGEAQPHDIGDDECHAPSAQAGQELPRARRPRQSAIQQILERRGQHGV